MALDHLYILRGDVEVFADAVAAGLLDAPVAGCPGWTLADLGAHLGGVHRWVIGAVTTGAPPAAAGAYEPAPVSDAAGLAAWVREGAATMIGLLERTDPTAPTWHPFPVEPKVAGLWRRRQAQEASVHRWDAEHAIGRRPVIDAELAADGIDEYFGVMLPRMLTREGRRTPDTVLGVRLTDRPERWVLDGASGLPVASGRASHAELIGDAESVLLRLWGRPAAHDPAVVGDGEVAAAWLALGGA